MPEWRGKIVELLKHPSFSYYYFNELNKIAKDPISVVNYVILYIIPYLQKYTLDDLKLYQSQNDYFISIPITPQDAINGECRI